jgi:HPt (histidine-containing phosphotransfer) domain-containing protein
MKNSYLSNLRKKLSNWFDPFGIKKLKMTKAELEQEVKTLRQYVVNLKADKDNLINQLQQAEGQIRMMSLSLKSLNEELNMRRSQDEATKRFNDDSKYY